MFSIDSLHVLWCTNLTAENYYTINITDVISSQFNFKFHTIMSH